MSAWLLRAISFVLIVRSQLFIPKGNQILAVVRAERHLRMKFREARSDPEIPNQVAPHLGEDETCSIDPEKVPYSRQSTKVGIASLLRCCVEQSRRVKFPEASYYFLIHRVRRFVAVFNTAQPKENLKGHSTFVGGLTYRFPS